ncbi:hypothetical protein [Natronosalvus vescus]|uniref:hypothetical protein n=1 Tax=Natronosalvus vescus TaxID=2953881 RepID=UPI0020914946|nr:hypothetical protein [Natronosalvus vescus]
MANLKYLYNRSIDIYRNQGIKRLVKSSGRFLIGNIIGSDRYYRVKYDIRQFRQQRKHGPVPHALDIRSASPKTIKRMSSTDPSLKWQKAGLIEDGDWDRSDCLFKNYDLYIAFQNRFESGCSWRDTGFYQRASNQIKEGRIKWGCQTVDELDARCEALDDLYTSIKKNGYIDRKDMTKNKGELPATDSFAAISSSPLHQYDEIAVDVGRSGELLFVDGRNRLAICKILDIDKIPVRIVRRHEIWQNHRQDIIEKDEKAYNHPDLVDLI